MVWKLDINPLYININSNSEIWYLYKPITREMIKMLKLKVFHAGTSFKKLEKISNDWFAQNPGINVRYQRFDNLALVILYEE